MIKFILGMREKEKSTMSQIYGQNNWVQGIGNVRGAAASGGMDYHVWEVCGAYLLLMQKWCRQLDIWVWNSEK